MSSTPLYTDLSRYYDLMCSEIDYPEQAEFVYRLHQLLGNTGKRHLDLGCGTGPHIRCLTDLGYQSSGLDIHQPMLDIARQRCPEAHFFQGDMSRFTVEQPLDLITCFLYSIHYTQTIARLKQCIASAHAALNPGGMFCFNAVDRTAIDNKRSVHHTVEQDGDSFAFHSKWHYPGQGEQQQLMVRIERTHAGQIETWQDQHPMVAISFAELEALLKTHFDVYVFEHAYERIEPWAGTSGNAFFACINQ